MDKKTMLPAVAIALLSCIALMLTVIGGLYAFNTFADDASPVAAQSAGTDKGPDWTVTPVTVGGDTQYVVVVQKSENPYEAGKEDLQMAVYELRQSGTAKCDLYFIAARTMAYDFSWPNISGESTNKKSYEPASLKKAAEEAKKK
jgi:hypothetical protein